MSGVAWKILLLLSLSTFVSTCSEKQSVADKHKSENDSSVTRAANEVPDGQSGVCIANSFIHKLNSKHTGNTYDIYISYPDHYETSGKKYPVLVVLDAEVNFGAIRYIVQRLVKDDLIPELLIVGVAYEGETDEDTYYSLRSRDFTPSRDEAQEQRHKDKFRAGSGGAENFVKFLSLELFPYVKNNCPAASEGRSMYGHSFGGLFGAHVFLNHPTLFDNYLLLSPSLWWNQKNILKDLSIPSTDLSKQIRLYVGTGALEGGMVDDHREMVNVLQRFQNDNMAVKSEILDNETHRSIFGRGFTNGLRFLYPKQ
jgi:predicted alpha/beta superfamily hydrolase